VGDGDSDHLCWERAEDMSTPRTAFKIDTNHPGSEVAAETAAALAAASKAFRPYDSMYADLLLLHAKQVRCCVCRNACICSLFLIVQSDAIQSTECSVRSTVTFCRSCVGDMDSSSRSPTRSEAGTMTPC